MLESWIFLLFFSLLIQFGYWYGLFAETLGGKKALRGTENPFVSIVIAVKNEFQNLNNHLDQILNQDYENYEVIAVDDHSSDDSYAYLCSIADLYPHFTVLRLPLEQKGKKMALTLGIKKARGLWIGLTDADCRPVSASWISGFMNYSGNADILLGYGPYKKMKGWLNKFIRFESWIVGLQYVSFATVGHAYMGVGRNLYYKKKIFEQVGGFASHKKLLSGDDDLFVLEASGLANTIPLISSETFTLSVPKKSIFALFQQKSRHISTSPHYPFKTQICLSLFFASHVLFIFSVGLGLLLFPSILITIYLLRLVCLYPVLIALLKKFEEDDLIWFYPIFEVLLVIYYILLSVTLFKKVKIWS